MAWQSVRTSGSSSAKANPTTFEGGVSFGAVTGEVEAEINSSDQKSLELKEALEGRDDATIKLVTDATSSHNKCRSQLTPEATAVLGIGLVLATGIYMIYEGVLPNLIAEVRVSNVSLVIMQSKNYCL